MKLATQAMKASSARLASVSAQGGRSARKGMVSKIARLSVVNWRMASCPRGSGLCLLWLWVERTRCRLRRRLSNHGWWSARFTAPPCRTHGLRGRSEEHTSELQSLMRISYAVFCLKKKKHDDNIQL